MWGDRRCSPSGAKGGPRRWGCLGGGETLQCGRTALSHPSPLPFLEEYSPVSSGSQFCCELRDALKWD